MRVFSLCVGVLLLLLLLCCAGEAQGRLRDVWDAVRQEAHEVMEQVRMVDMHQAEKMIRDMLGEVMGEEAAGTLRAGAARVDGTPPLGVPLAGYNHGARAVPNWPLPEPREYTTFMMPSTGVLNPSWVRGLVIDNGKDQVCFLSVEAIGADGSLFEHAIKIAHDQGFPLPVEKIVLCGAHTHSGPGAVSPERLWELAPATDLLVDSIRTQFASSVAAAMVEAYAAMRPAKVGLGWGELVGVTRNRRANMSPYVNVDSIDPHLGIIRVDALDGTPIATVWNFATHGTCYGPDNMSFSGDIMGYASQLVETATSAPALFINADAGDIDPTNAACANKPFFNGSSIIADKIMQVRETIVPSADVDFQVYSKIYDFGNTNLNLTVERVGTDCDHGGPLDICNICKVLKCDLNLHLDGKWIENTPKFTAIRWTIGGHNSLMVSIPGEPLLELGWQIRNDTLKLGFDDVFLMGYTNNHMGYFAPPDEYEVGGYEGLLTFWGVNTAEWVRGYCKEVAEQVKPQ